MKIKKLQPFFNNYTDEDYKRDKESRLSYERHCKWIKEQNFKVGDSVIYENEVCEILRIFNFDQCVLKHKNHKEEHLLSACEKIN